MIQHNALVSRNIVRILLGILLLTLMVQEVMAETTSPFTLIRESYGPGSNDTAVTIATDSSGTVYLADPSNRRIQEYSSDGSLRSFWDFGSTGAWRSISIRPYGIAVDAARTMYITDCENNTVWTFTTTGGSTSHGSEGTGDGQFSHPTGIAVDSSGNVYVADTGNNRIQKFHSTGTYLLQWGSYGTADGAFNAPTGIAVDSNGLIYVTDTGNHRIQKFNPSGTFLATWGTAGTGSGQFSAPIGIATDSWGNVWVADLTPRIQKFSPTGEYFASFNTSGANIDVAIDPSGTVYALWKSDGLWKIGRQTVSLPAELPQPAHTFAVMIGQDDIPAGVTMRLPVPAAATHTSVPPLLPVTTIAPATPSPAISSNETPAQPGNRSGGDIGKPDLRSGILDHIFTLFQGIFGQLVTCSA